MPTVEVFIAANGDDGSVSRNDSVYPPTTNPSTSMGTSYALSEKSLVGGVHYVTCGLLRFNTGAVLPDSATINSAKLRFYNESADNTDLRSLRIEWYPGATWASAGTASDSDWVALVNNDAGTRGLGTILPAGAYEETLSLAATNVSLTGYTGLRLGISGTAPTGPHNAYICSLEHPTFTETSLFINYTDAPAIPTLFAPGGSGLRW